MSAISPIENVVVAEVVVKAPKVKKPALPAKLQKFASTMYFILQKFNEQGLISDEDLERGIVENYLFDHVDNLQQQTVVLQALLDQQPAALKSFRKTATARNKPPKAPKPVKAPKEKKEPKEKKAKEPKAKEPKAKEPKAKKEKAVSEAEEPVVAVEEPVVASTTAASVAAALASAPAASTAATITPATTKSKKTKAAKAVVNEVVSEAEVEVVAEAEVEVVEEKKVEKVKKEKKEKVAKETKEKVVKEKVAKKTKNAPKVTSDADEDLIGQIVAAARSSNSEREEREVDVEEEEEDEDGVIQTREFSFEGTLYLIDQDNVLYSSTSHEQIGSFDPASNSIVPL